MEGFRGRRSERAPPPSGVGRAKKEASEGAAPSDVVRPTDCELRQVVSLREGEGRAPQKVAGGGDSGGGMQSAAPMSGWRIE